MKRVSVSRLEPHPKNARRHPEENIKIIVKSLKTFGQVTPLVINEKMQVLKGNGTLEAIKRLGWKKAKCIEVSLNYGGVQVNFNQSQKPVIDRAIKLYCNKVDNHRMTNADALYEIVREWMKSKTIKSKKGDGK